MQDLLIQINDHCGWDCQITAFDGWKLMLSSGSSDVHVKPLAELAGVSFMSCPMAFSHPMFRLGDASERQRISAVVPLEPSDLLLAIEAETMAGLQRQVFYILAESLTLAPAWKEQ